jgi:hypothetical protein
MKPIPALAAVPLLLCLAQVTRSQAQDLTWVWREMAKDSDAVVTARVIEPERPVERPDLRVGRVLQLFNGGFMAEIRTPYDYRLGNVWTLRVDAVHKPDGRVAVGGVMRVFLGLSTHLDQEEVYVLFLKNEILELALDRFRGTTLVSAAGSAAGQQPDEVAFDPKGEHVYGRTPVSGDSSIEVSATVPIGGKSAAEMAQIHAGIQQSLAPAPTPN